MAKSVFKIIMFFIVGLIGGIFADQILWPYFIERPLFFKYRIDNPPVEVTEVNEIYIRENEALEEAIDKVKDSVAGIQIRTKQSFLKESGWIITHDGLLVSLCNSFPDPLQILGITVYVDGEEVEAELVEEKDSIVSMKIEKDRLTTNPVLDIEKVNLGERVFLVKPLFQEDKVVKMVNLGIVRGKDKNIIYTNIIEDETAIGGILFDIEGYILGIANGIDSYGRLSALSISEIRNSVGF